MDIYIQYPILDKPGEERRKYGRNFMYDTKLNIPVIKSIFTKLSICKKTFRTEP